MPGLNRFVRIVAVAIVYGSAARLGLQFDALAGVATTVWPASGIALAALVLGGTRLWPGVAVGAFVANALTGIPFTAALAIAAGNTAEAVVGAALLRRTAFDPRLDRVRDVLALTVLAAAISTLIAATVGAAAMALHGLGSDYLAMWGVWWVGDMMGILLVGGAGLAWFAAPPPRIRPRRVVEAIALAVASIVLSAVAFGVLEPPIPLASPHLVFLPLLWAALRFRQRGASAAMLAISTIAVVATASGQSGFVAASPSDSLVMLHVFIGPTAVLVMLTAATTAERREALLARDQSLALAAQASRIKDEFLAMLGHELRNPLAPIVTALELLKRKANGEVSREQQVIERQVAHLSRLVDDLLDVSRIARGLIRVVRERLELTAVIAEVAESVRTLAADRGLELEAVIPPRPIVVDGDRVRLTQLVGNLLSNSVRYTPAGGHIRIAVARDGPEAVVKVTDDGEGIDPALLPNIFDMFVQGRQSPHRHTGGLGVGLSLVRSFAEIHGGRVAAASAGRGAGSEFTVWLPLAPAEHAAVPAIAVCAPESGTPRRILVVDDNHDAADTLAALLRSVGHEVEVAHDPVRALEVAPGFRPEIAILDLGLPTMDGYELARRLKLGLSAAPPRLLAVTGYAQDHDRERTHESGFEHHFVKPVDGEALIQAIDELPPAATRDE